MITATVIADASYCPVIKRGAFGAWIKVDGVSDAIRLAGPLRDYGMGGSGLAEVCAALNGIWAAARVGAKRILVRSDCMTVCHLIDGRCKKARPVEFWRDAMNRPEFQGLELIGKHVKGHNDTDSPATWVNDWCHKQAYKELQKIRKTNGYSKASRRSRSGRRKFKPCPLPLRRE